MKGFVLLVLFVIVTNLSSIDCFNLETRIPIIKRGSAGSYFGYSVAEHQEIIDDGPSTKSWMLVGAPLDQNQQPSTNRSGALWQCPLSTNTTDCNQVITDGRTNVDSDNLSPPNYDHEINNGQWLGVTVKSQGIGGRVMVCAHRHIRKLMDAQWAQGKCYIFSHNFTHEKVTNPCSGKYIRQGHNDYDYGFCQVGTSGVFVSKNSVLIGAPGILTWNGNVFIVSIYNDNILSQNVPIREIKFDNPSLQKYIYLGMSVAVGKFFGNNIAYATGAPRSNGTGQVFILSENDANLTFDLVLNGEQFASSFGYEIATADVNGDNKTDLIVAAPFYFNKEEGGAVYVYTTLCQDSTKCPPTKLVGHEESRFGFALTNLGDLHKDGYEDIAIGAPYEGKGAVYIYLGSKDGIVTIPSQVIHAEDTPLPLQTFGYSLSGGMDMDKNGYPDLLVGAYDSSAVFLFLSKEIIDIDTYIRYALENGTYQNKIDAIDPNKRGCLGDPQSKHICFTFEACCTIPHLLEKSIQNIKLNYYIEAETYSGVKTFSRVWFAASSNLKQHYINRAITLKPSKLTHCQNETVYLKENIRDIQSSIKFRLNYTLIQDVPQMPAEGEALPNLKKYPILNQQKSDLIFEATFKKDCGDNDICESNIEVKAKLNLSVSTLEPNSYELLLGEKEELVVEVDVTNSGESAYEAELFITHSSSLNYIASKSSDFLSCTSHNTTMVFCSLGNPFKKDKSVNIKVRFDPKKLDSDESQLNFLIFANSTSKEIEEKRPIQLFTTVLKLAELSIKGSAKTQWAFYGGPIVGESAMKHFKEIGPKVSHIYEVFNEGPWKVNTVKVLISWPYEVANDKSHGKWLLYLEELPMVQSIGNGICKLPQGHIVNPLKLQGGLNYDDSEDSFETRTTPFPRHFNQRNHIRDKRDTEKVINTRIIIDENGNRHQVVSMNCKAGTAKCFDIECLIHNLPRKQGATIVVKARLWNSTLIEDYPKVNKVIIGSNAKIISTDVIQQKNLIDDQATAETIAYPDLLDQQEKEFVPTWMIVIAVLTGLLLLIFLTLILRRLGFFKRRRPDPTLSGNLEKHRDDNPENELLFKH